jgi:Ragulator complex protein LAMTOR5
VLLFSVSYIAKGEVVGSQAGRYTAISRTAASIHPDMSPPTILIETADRNILIKNYDSMTIVMKCDRQEI